MLEPLTRAGAQEAAAAELSKGIYQSQRPSLRQQLASALLRWLDDGLQAATSRAPGGVWGLVALVLLLVAAVIAIRLQTGPLARRAGRPDRPDPVGATLSPDQHRRNADRHAAAGRYAEAVRERLRALVADLERRAVLDPRPARTADEMAGEAGAVLPTVADDLRRAARTFDDVWYGSRRATSAMDADLREVDRRVQQARPVGSGAAASPAAALAEPAASAEPEALAGPARPR